MNLDVFNNGNESKSYIPFHKIYEARQHKSNSFVYSTAGILISRLTRSVACEIFSFHVILPFLLLYFAKESVNVHILVALLDLIIWMTDRNQV